MAVRLARRRPGAAADGLFPSTRHSSARSGAAAAALERSLRGSGSAPAQQHRIAARRRGAGRGGHGAAPLAVVRSNGGHARPLEHAAIFSCHGGGAAGAAGRTGRSSSSGGRRRAVGWVLYERWGGGRRCASLLLRPGQRERLIRVRSRGAEERERERDKFLWVLLDLRRWFGWRRTGMASERHHMVLGETGGGRRLGSSGPLVGV
jgi:hypothetical protein